MRSDLSSVVKYILLKSSPTTTTYYKNINVVKLCTVVRLFADKVVRLL